MARAQTLGLREKKGRPFTPWNDFSLVA